MNGFWSEGPMQLRLALKERKAEIDQLLSASRDSLDPRDKAAAKKRLRELLDEYSPTEDEIDRSLFFL